MHIWKLHQAITNSKEPFCTPLQEQNSMFRALVSMGTVGTSKHMLLLTFGHSPTFLVTITLVHGAVHALNIIKVQTSKKNKPKDEFSP